MQGVLPGRLVSGRISGSLNEPRLWGILPNYPLQTPVLRPFPQGAYLVARVSHRIRNPAYWFSSTEGSNPSLSAKINNLARFLR